MFNRSLNFQPHVSYVINIHNFFKKINRSITYKIGFMYNKI